MSRATFVYIVMLAVFGTGLWVILSFGSILLHAPVDLAGKWKLLQPVASTDEESNGDTHTTLLIEQSGRYFNLSMQGRRWSMKLTSEARQVVLSSELVQVTLQGRDESATLVGPLGGDEYTLHVTGPVSGTWLARRIERQYPKPVPRRTAPAPAASQPTVLPATAHARL